MQRRFGGIGRLYGEPALQRFTESHIVVVGVGGVGSWAAESFARSAIGRLTLIDMDHVAESNINRQLPALESTLGKAKVQVLAERIADINPGCEVNSIEDFVTLENTHSLLPAAAWVVDCIDNANTKAALIADCRRQARRVITVGAAGGQVDPTRIRVSDLRRTEQDALLARTRRQLRREYGFPTNPRRSFGVSAVWSDEPLRQSRGCSPQSEGSLNCAGFGACMPVTASFGLAAAAHVLQRLAEEVS